MKLKTDNHIILDKNETWPKEFNILMQSNSELIINFLAEEERIDELCQRDLSVRFSKKELNPYKLNFQNLINDLERIIQKHKLVGIHCTRLLNEEIESLKEDGLKPLSQELAISKIELANSKGVLSDKLKIELLTKDEYRLDCRTDMAYFFHCLSTLKEEHGLRKLFGYWGGEAIYMYNNDSEELKTIGTPCIVILSVKISELESFLPLSERMIRGLFKNDFDSQDSDSTMRKPVKVLEVIEHSMEKFEELTNYSTWEEASMN